MQTGKSFYVDSEDGLDAESGSLYTAYTQEGLTADEIATFRQTVIRIRRSRAPETYLSDGKREIDFIMTYEISAKEMKPQSRIFEEQKEYWRRKFFRNLKKLGAILEKDLTITTKKKIFFVKVHVPFDILCIYAEDLGLQLPFAYSEDISQPYTSWLFDKLHLYNPMELDVPNEPPPVYSCAFRSARIDRYLQFEQPSDIFSTRHRHIIVNEILQTMPFGKRSKKEVGIGQLLQLGAFSGVFPMHDGPYQYNEEDEPTQLTQRQILHKYWANWHCWHKHQPLSHVREYFGEKVAIYFAWLGFYTAWLHSAALAGWIAFMYGMITLVNDQSLLEICYSGDKYKMCPVCEGCKDWKLSDYCGFYAAVRVFDNPGMVYFSIFMSCWSILFMQFWKRTNESLSYRWSMHDFELTERSRAEYEVRCTNYRSNPITGVLEPFFPTISRIPRMMASVAILIIMIMVVIIFIVTVIIYRMVMTGSLNAHDTDNSGSGGQVQRYSGFIASLTATAIQLALIVSMGTLYKYLAYLFTDWEMHRTRTEFEDNLVIKVYIFQFVNYYSSVLYVAFFKGRFCGTPENPKKFLGFKIENCSEQGCFFETCQQVFIFMVAKQIVSNVKEIIQPKLKKLLRKFKAGSLAEGYYKRAWELEYEMPDEEGLFEEYLEMTIQFGFVTVFVVAFPLAPFFALLNNYIEIRLDAQKYVKVTRRPLAERAQDLGSWLNILSGLTQFSILTNAILVAFSSTVVPKFYHKMQNNGSLDGFVTFTLRFANVTKSNPNQIPCYYRATVHPGLGLINNNVMLLRILYIIVFEHVIFCFYKFVEYMIPESPNAIQMKVEKERHLTKEVMVDSQVKERLRESNIKQPKNYGMHLWNAGGEHDNNHGKAGRTCVLS